MDQSGGRTHHHGHHHDAADFDHMGSFLISEERRKWQNPERILDLIDAPRTGLTVDLGCGPGFFTLPAAVRAVGEGTVVGIDSSSRLLTLCRQRLDGADGAEAELILMELRDLIPLVDSSADFILMANVLHDFPSPVRLLADAARVLKPGGRFVNIDWKKERQEFGPPFGVRFSAERSLKMLSDAGLAIQSTPEIGPYHYCIIARRS